MENENIKLTGGGGIRSPDLFKQIISLENLFLAWKEFKRGKSKKKDAQKFRSNLGQNISNLHNELKNKIYRHSDYFSFYVKDPKLRHIHKACVKDRVLHHAIFRILYPIFDKSFIFDSYSCRLVKGTHRAINRLNYFAKKVSRNNTKTCFILKCDIRKFFDSIDQKILIGLIKVKMKDEDLIWLINKAIGSYFTILGKGIPLGNIISQLFANIYLNELDQFIKHKLKMKYYIRYCDDFVILNNNREYLEDLTFRLGNFINSNLKLLLHPDKISIRKYHQGADFLGYVSFPYNRILRVKTEKRIIKKIKEREAELRTHKITKDYFSQIIQSYFGVLKHCNSYKIKKDIFNKFLGMIIFLYGQDSYRAKEKLKEIIEEYKTKHKSGLNLIQLDAKEAGFEDLFNNLKITSMFDEKKLIILKNVFSSLKFQEEFLDNIASLKNIKDIIVIYEKDSIDQRSKFFKLLKKEVKCQEFCLLPPAMLKKWIKHEFEKYGAKINQEAEDLLFELVGNNLWQMGNEIKKLADYKSSAVIKKEDIELHVRPKIENDIFLTIDALASKNKKQALNFLHKHIEAGENPLYLLSMIAYQFKNLLIIKELIDQRKPYAIITSKSGLHPFVFKKSYYMCSQFSMAELKKIYQKIFQADLNIKSGRIEPETALDMLVAEI